MGLEKKRSTEDALLRMVNLVLTGINKGKKVAAIFLDVRKAFDTVNHGILVAKLRSLNFSELFIRLMSSYLDERGQRVRLLDKMSSSLPVECGVPQGSVLGPLLFLLYVNDVYQLSFRSEIITYADDTCMIVEEQDFQRLNDTLNSELILMTKWMTANGFSINNAKTNYMIFELRDTVHDEPVVILHEFKSLEECEEKRCDCRPIQCVDCTKYLGIMIDKNLNFKRQIEHLTKKVRYGLYILGKMRSIADRKLRKTLYFAFVQSHIQYAITVWGGRL
jgi:hypothetical protein